MYRAVVPVMSTVVYFDGRCAVCAAARSWVERRDRESRVRFVDFHSAQDDDLPLPRERLTAEVAAVRADGEVSTGVHAWLDILADLPRWRVLAACVRRLRLTPLGRPIYRLIAANRHRFRGRCTGGAGQRCRPRV